MKYDKFRTTLLRRVFLSIQSNVDHIHVYY